MATRLILIIDDDPGVRATLARGFLTRGCRVETADNGAEALEILERTRPSLTLLDLDMPVLDGWGFARELRQRGLNLPFVLLSNDRGARDTARAIGAVGYLSKPSVKPHSNGSSARAA